MTAKILNRVILDVRSVNKSFSGINALQNVQLSISSGEVVALLGENGAGKSTLMKIICGAWPLGTYEGEVWVESLDQAKLELAQFKNTRDAHHAGIVMIHQELSVFTELTVAEHLELDELPMWIHWDLLFERVQKFLDTLGFGLHAQWKVGNLSVGNRQLVEIARALYKNAKIIIFDEPTSALSEHEVLQLYRVVDQLRAAGKAIIYITHRLDEVFQLADRMVVLRDGQNVGELAAYSEGLRVSRLKLQPQLITWMVGRPIEDIYPPLNQIFGSEFLRVQNLSLVSPCGKIWVDNISFTLRKGEILGLAGLLGAGRSEILGALFGFLNGESPKGVEFKISGEIWMNGRHLKVKTPRDAILEKMAYVSEDRKGSGLVLNQSICSNMILAALAAGENHLSKRKNYFSFVYTNQEQSSTQKWVKELRIKSTHLSQAVGELSGGNQQKVILAKWLMTSPELLFLDEPTRGVDVGAKVEIYNWIQNLASNGMGMVVASSEMPELLGICHRILVLRNGHVSAEFTAKTVSQEDIMRAASL